MQRVDLSKKVVDLGIRGGLGVVSQAYIHPIWVAIGQVPGEGTTKIGEQGKINEAMTTSTQPPPDTATTSTQPPSAIMTQEHVITPSNTTPVTISVSTPVATTVTMTSIPTPPPLVQKAAPTITPTTERVIIHNIESDSDQEDQKPIMHLAQKKVEKKKRKKPTRHDK